MYIEPINIESSYYINNKGNSPELNIAPYFKPKIGKILYDYIIKLKPKVIVEFGVLEGFSTICMAQALKKLGRGNIYSYDLWNSYPYKHSSKEKVLKNLKLYEVENFVTLCDGDFNKWCNKNFKCDLLHLDISNDGEVIENAYKKINCDIIFEGGSLERDNCWWMKKFNKKPINSIKNKVNYKVLNDNFPSISLIKTQ